MANIIEYIIYVHSYVSDMKSAVATKVIRLQGTSLVIIATKELSLLGLQKGDQVKVTFERVTEDPQEEYDGISA